MKEWISDKKNQPIVIGVASAVILCTVVFLLFQLGVLGNNNANVVQAPAGTSEPGMPPPPMPGAPGPPPGAPPAAGGFGAPAPSASGAPAVASAAPAAAAKPVRVARGGKADPFQPSYNVKSLIPEAPRVDIMVPVTQMASLPGLDQSGVTPTIAPPLPVAPAANVPLGQISGIVFSNGVRAIYESNGTATVVQPGDQLPDGAGRVASIQTNSVTIAVTGGGTVNIPVTAGTVDGTDQQQQQNGNPPPPGV